MGKGVDDGLSDRVTRQFVGHRRPRSRRRRYAAISPNLHFREGKGTPEANSASVRAAGGMPDNRTMGDVEGAIRYLRSLAALRLAGQPPER